MIVQTYEPDHYGIQLAAAQDFRAFYRKESAFRRSALYPPFTQIVRIVYSGKDEKQVRAAERDARSLPKTEKMREFGALRQIRLDFVFGCEVYYNRFRMERRAVAGADHDSI